jgi:hypothetical protein
MAAKTPTNKAKVAGGKQRGAKRGTKGSASTTSVSSLSKKGSTQAHIEAAHKIWDNIGNLQNR